MASVTVKVLNEPRARGKAIMCSVITSSLKFGEIVIFGSDLRDRFESRFTSGRFYRVVNVVVMPRDGGSITVKLTTKTRVFATVPFDIPEDVEAMFFNAPETSIGDVLVCKEKKRVTIVGRVKTVSPVKEGGTWTRKEVVVTDLAGRQSVVVNLWGEKAKVVEADVNDLVRVTNCETAEFRDVVSLNGTQETDVLPGNPDDIREEVLFIGVTTENNGGAEVVVLVRDDDKIFELGQGVLQDVFPGGVREVEEELPLQCTVRYRDVPGLTAQILGITL